MTIETWERHLLKAASHPTQGTSGVRRLVTGFTWEWKVKDLKKLPIQFVDLGYASTASKMRQLDRNYYNPESWKFATDQLNARKGKVSAFTVSLNAKEKDIRSQGFCMVGGVLYRGEKDETSILTVFYRSTELFQKHTADLLWLKERLPDHVETVRFMAASAYMTALFFPIYARFSDHPEKLISSLDEISLKTVGGGIRPFLKPTHNYTYKHRVKMWTYFHDHVSKEKTKRLEKVCPKRAVDLKNEDDDE